MPHAPRSPGYYPAPDGRGEQWWNGVAWSESRRGAGSAVLSNSTPVHSNITPTGIPTVPVRRPASGLPLASVVLGILSLTVNLLAPVAAVVALVSFVRAPRSRLLALIGLGLAVVAFFSGLAQFEALVD